MKRCVCAHRFTGFLLLLLSFAAACPAAQAAVSAGSTKPAQNASQSGSTSSATTQQSSSRNQTDTEQYTLSRERYKKRSLIRVLDTLYISFLIS